jgi:hypothetical protein
MSFLRSSKPEDKIPLKIKKVVVIGDGPIGLIAALVLKLKGINVSLVGSYLDDFTRSYNVSKVSWEKVQELIAPFKLVIPEETLHLKEMERQLYDFIIQLKIPIFKKQFHSFAPGRKIILVDKNSSDQKVDPKDKKGEQLLEADMVIDCTGTKRAVIKEYNKFRNGEVFKEVMDESTIKRYGSLRTISNELVRFQLDTYCKKFEQKSPNPICYALAMEELREQGWDSFKIPVINQKVSPNKKSFSSSKYHLVMQIPNQSLAENKQIQNESSFTQDKLIKYAKTLYKLVGNDPSKEYKITMQDKSKKHTKKPMFSIYDSFSSYVIPAFDGGNEDCPFLLHLGDASHNKFFQEGSGVYYGVVRMIDTLAALIINDKGLITGIFGEALNQRHHQVVADDFASKEIDKFLQKIYQPWTEERHRKMYEDAYAQCQNVKDREKIKNGLIRQVREILIKEKASLVTEDKIASIPQHLDSLALNIALNEMKNQLSNSLKRLSGIEKCEYLPPEDKKNIDEMALQITVSYKTIGSRYYQKKNINPAIQCYETALSLSKQCDYPVTESLALYSNLLITHHMKKSYDKMIQLADEVEAKIFPRVDWQQPKNIAIGEKIKYHKVLALLGNLEKRPADDLSMRVQQLELAKRIEPLILELSSKDIQKELLQRLLPYQEPIKQSIPALSSAG